MNEAVTIILPIPNPVLSPNVAIGSYGGRMKKASAAKRYRRLAREAVEAEEVESIPWERVIVSAKFFSRDKRRRDTDNAMASLKSAYDGIVDSGIVVDDDWEHMMRGIPSFDIDKINPRVELTITRCVDAVL